MLSNEDSPRSIYRKIQVENKATAISWYLQNCDKFLSTVSKKTRHTRPLLVYVSGTTSVGKDVMLHRLTSRARNENIACEMLRKYTTREPRPNESAISPFQFLSVQDFKRLEEQGEIACVRVAFDSRYGIDSTFSKGIEFKEVLFVSTRLYYDIVDEIKSLAAQNGFDIFTMLLIADRQSIQDRLRYKPILTAERVRLFEQMVDDFEFLDSNREKVFSQFDVVVDNSDSRAIRDSLDQAWIALRARLIATQILLTS
jgi:guanylate kinase